jgi:hypothetical protein
VLVIFFAGFATAIYCLAPVNDHAYVSGNKGVAHSALKSDEFAKSFNTGMRKGLSYSKDAARRVSAYLKEDADGRKRKP